MRLGDVNRGYLWALLLVMGATDCERVFARRADGESCIFNGDCESPLVCAARRCRAPCRDDRDCHNAYTCRPQIRTACGDAPCPPPRLRLCVEPGGPELCFADSDCADPAMVCGPDDTCRYTCTPGSDDTCEIRFGRGARCVARDGGGALCEAPAVTATDASVDATDAAVTDAPALDAPPPRDVPADAREASVDVARDVDPDATITALGCAVVQRPGACAPGAAGCAITKVSRGVSHACALFEDGSLRCWGDNAHGQSGERGVASACTVPGVSHAGPWRDAATGQGFTCVVDADAHARCWGWNVVGQCGTGAMTTDDVGTPTVVLRTDGTSLSDVRAVFAGNGRGCAIVGADGRVACWGSGGAALGPGVTGTRPSAAEVSGITGAVGIAISSGATCAWGADGASYCFGLGTQLADGGAISGSRPTPQRTLFPSARAVVMTSLNTCALATSGAVWCAGSNSFGGLGDGAAMTLVTTTPVAVTGLSDAVELVSGGHAICARRGDGSVWCWGAWAQDLVNPTSYEQHPVPAAMPLGTGPTRVYAGGGDAVSLGLCGWYGGADLRCVGTYPGEGSSAVALPARVNWTGRGL